MDGMALAPYYELPGLSFDTMVDEVAALGASHLSVVVSWSQPNVRASRIAPHPKETQGDAVVRTIIRRGHARGLKVLLFPILWVERRSIGEWRGTLRPDDPDVWWREYRRFVMHYAKMAAEERVAVFSVGSELASLESQVERWRALIASVRGVFGGRLLYSANWDHYAGVPFWTDVDLVGLTGYYRLTESTQPAQEELDAAWRAVRDRLVKWQRGVGRPLVFTELGYPSIDGAARSPWDYTGARSTSRSSDGATRRSFAPGPPSPRCTASSSGTGGAPAAPRTSGTPPRANRLKRLSAGGTVGLEADRSRRVFGRLASVV